MNAGFRLSRQQSRLADQLAMEKYGMPGIVLMENAGRGSADVLCRLGIRGPVVICCGAGNNGGDGFVIARHLDLRNYAVRVLLWCEPSRLRGDAAQNYRVLVKSQVPLVECAGRNDPDWVRGQLRGADWIVDALLGTGAEGEPRPPYDRAIEVLNAVPARKMAVDVPSGLDCDTGRPSRCTFRAEHTCTFLASKVGFYEKTAEPFVGQLHVLDIGAPRRLIADVLGATESG